ncbi:MAG: hypothetical protein QW520_00190 [Methanomassiliicoccales archaeon]
MAYRKPQNASSAEPVENHHELIGKWQKIAAIGSKKPRLTKSSFTRYATGMQPWSTTNPSTYSTLCKSLGRGNITNILKYTQIINFTYEEYNVKAAYTE